VDKADAPATIDPEQLSVVLATDVGSTTTKAILFERSGGQWRMTHRGEAPTTVESPFDDVTIGARNAFAELEDLSGRSLVSDGGPSGVDLYVSTSSAGGGLQMMVAGVIGTMTAESAQRAALGAGAIVMDVISADDGREMHDRVRTIRRLRPDIVLLAGGVDGGTISHVVELAELLVSADPKPRFGKTLTLPVVYCGNRDARGDVERLLGERTDLVVVDNIRPVLERENLGPAREAIHEVFLSHVMSHAPGYDKLMSWTPVPVMSTPAAVGSVVETHARESGRQVLAVDIGGATTDVFSVFAGVFNRTVSANLGMSYSAGNVLLEAGARKIARWLPFDFDEGTLRDLLRNKMIRPTTIPETREELIIEQAVAREALRLAFGHHKELATGLKGVHLERNIDEAFSTKAAGDSIVDMPGLDLVIGSGGVLSHAPDRRSAALMMLDAFELEGITEIAVDSVFMMPHLGVLASVAPRAADEIFTRDCLVPLGCAVAPVGRVRPEATAAEVSVRTSSGTLEEAVVSGLLRRVELPEGEEVEVTARPTARFDLGAGRGVEVSARARTGPAGLILDGRGRPLQGGGEWGPAEVGEWLRAMGLEW